MARVKKKAFTLIELMVVMAIIAVLSVLIVGAISIARRTQNNTRRRSDLNTIAMAIIAYESQNKTHVEAECNCGIVTSRGSGWFNLTYAGTTESISQYLFSRGFLKEELRDPIGPDSYASGAAGHAYMKATCVLSGQKRTFLYARMEGVAASDTATDGTCFSNWDTSYGMNYYIEVK